MRFNVVFDCCENPKVSSEVGKEDAVSILCPKCLYVNLFWFHTTLGTVNQMLELHDIHLTKVLVKSEHWSVPQVGSMRLVGGQVRGLSNQDEITVRLGLIPFSESILVALFHLLSSIMRPSLRSFFLNSFERHTTVNKVLWVI